MKIARKAVMASWAKERPGKSKQYRNNWCAGGIGVKEKWHLQNVCVRKIQSAVISQSFSHLPLRNPASKCNLLASALSATTQCGRSCLRPLRKPSLFLVFVVCQRSRRCEHLSCGMLGTLPIALRE